MFEDRRLGQRGPLKRTKARNLLERFVNFEEDVMRFMDNEITGTFLLGYHQGLTNFSQTIEFWQLRLYGGRQL